MTKQDVQNLLVLCEQGARALSAGKSLQESVQIQAAAVELLEKISKLTPLPEVAPVDPPAVD